MVRTLHTIIMMVVHSEIVMRTVLFSTHAVVATIPMRWRV